MQEIIIKRDGSNITSLEIVNEKLRLCFSDGEMGFSEDFALEEIDDLIESISIMKDKMQRKTFVYNFPDGLIDKETLEKLTGLTIIATNPKND